MLRNRLEATNKENMEELRACLFKTTGDISRQLERAGLGGHRALARAQAAGDSASRSGGGNGGGRGGVAWADGRHDKGVDEPRPSLAWNEISLIVDDRLDELEERLERRASELEERMGVMMKAQMDALARKLDSVVLHPLQPGRSKS